VKKLPPEIIEKILDFDAESDLSLPAFAIEKDHFVLAAITLIQMFPVSPDFRFVFCGGTCLAKAYGILHRMSEDVDFKLVPTAAAAQIPIMTLTDAFAAIKAVGVARQSFRGGQVRKFMLAQRQ